MPVFPALGRLSQEDCKVRPNLDYIPRPRVRKLKWKKKVRKNRSAKNRMKQIATVFLKLQKNYITWQPVTQLPAALSIGNG